jgi:hypothetical protein
VCDETKAAKVTANATSVFSFSSMSDRRSFIHHLFDEFQNVAAWRSGHRIRLRKRSSGFESR